MLYHHLLSGESFIYYRIRYFIFYSYLRIYFGQIFQGAKGLRGWISKSISILKTIKFSLCQEPTIIIFYWVRKVVFIIYIMHLILYLYILQTGCTLFDEFPVNC